VRRHRPASACFVRRPKKRRPFHDVPVMARATALARSRPTWGSIAPRWRWAWSPQPWTRNR